MIVLAASAVTAAVLLAAACALLIAALRDCRNSHRDAQEAYAQERAMLLQRVQAPEIAAAQHAARSRTAPLYVPPDDDEAYWHSKQHPEAA